MFFPINIASKLAKKKAKREQLVKELEKLDKEIQDLEGKEVAKKD